MIMAFKKFKIKFRHISNEIRTHVIEAFNAERAKIRFEVNFGTDMKILEIKEIDAIKNFIGNLEDKLILSDATFEKFYSSLWYFLCGQSKPRLRQISKELKIIGKYSCDTNIGNIREEIVIQLGIEFMIN